MSQTFLKNRPERPHSFNSNELRLSENQKKVISDKYLKGDPSVEVWLHRVAHNIALAELIHHPEAVHWNLYDGVRIFKKDRHVLFHYGLHSADEREKNFGRFLANCDKAVASHETAKQLVETWEHRYFDLLASWKFLPNSPTLMNAGRDLQQLSACYVLPVEDSIEGITHALQAQALIHKSGGGTGFSFEKVRPAGDTVKSTSGVASGVISFMKVFDKMTEVVKQGGNRRGANMAILPYWHPEIKDFIRLKSRPGVLENFNISVAVDDSFMDAVKNGWEYNLINPRTNESVGRANAKEIFTLITENAWRSGDPGLVFIDKINMSRSQPTPALGKISATNPCGEQPLLPNEPCNLGSINLSLFVKPKDTGSPIETFGDDVDWLGLEETIQTAVRFLDDVIDVNNYPLAEIESMAKGNRRIGLGIMGWAEMLVKMGIPYDSDEALVKAQEVMSYINNKALQFSEKLAEERGVFPNWKNSIYDPESPHFAGEPHKPRHSARTTIAPTGTIGLAAGLQGAGIEPFYGIAYTRYNARAIEKLKKGQTPDPQDTYFEVNQLFKDMARQENFFGMDEKELWAKIEHNKKSVRGLAEIPENIQRLFPTAHDVSIDFHVKMQATFQMNTDNAVSKTINMAHEASIQDVADAYLAAHQNGCKGITIYRDGSKQQQVLNLSSSEKRIKRARDFSVGVSSEYYQMKTVHGPLHVHVDYDEDGPFRISTSLESTNTEMQEVAALIGTLMTQLLEQGGNASGLLKKFGVNSLPHAVSVALKNHLKKHGWLEEKSEEGSLLSLAPDTIAGDDGVSLELWNLTQAGEKCPRCFSANITHNAGCSGPLCQDCGYSECNI